jgi:single-strand DNA-binding protein
MPSLNKVQIIGHLGKDPELAYTSNGTARCNFSVAVSRRYQQAGAWKEETEWFNCTAWADLAVRLAENVRKGNAVYIEGRLQTRSWETDGVKHYRTEVVAQTYQNLTKREDSGNAPTSRAPRESVEIDEEDLPFE